MNDKLIAAVRTMCAAFGPGLLAVVVTWFAAIGINIEITSELQLAAAVLAYGAVTGLWNLGVNLLAERHPNIGFLLGLRKMPTYEESLGDNAKFPDLESYLYGGGADEPPA